MFKYLIIHVSIFYSFSMLSNVVLLTDFWDVCFHKFCAEIVHVNMGKCCRSHSTLYTPSVALSVVDQSLFSDYVRVADQVSLGSEKIHMVEYSPCYLSVCPSVHTRFCLSVSLYPFCIC